MYIYAKTKFILPLILSLLGLSSAQAAAVFDPEAINTDPVTLVKTIQPLGYVGSPVASGYNLTSTQNAYVLDYDGQKWAGNLHSYPMQSNGAITKTDNWVVGTNVGAAAKIDAQNFDTGRNIVTMNGSSNVAFRWGSLSATQQTALGNENVLSYIRGDVANESPLGSNYRPRDTVLGDIIHSTPLHWEHDHITAGDVSLRTVFVGSNDGMLHAIDAVNGTERFAYIPSMLIPKLSNLTSLTYQHKYYVDGQMAARRFSNISPSKSILVGGLGGGGKGLYALDITNAATNEVNAAGKILWELTPTTRNGSNTTDYANLGHTYGTPVLTKLPDSGGTPVAIVANGYNNQGNYQAYLYVINALTGAKIAEFKAGTLGTVASPNGLSSPTVIDSDFDGKIDTAYAGDIDGKLWKFDLSTLTSTSNLSVTCVSASTALTAGGCKELYSAGQAITMAPGTKKHPSGGHVVTFVTGKIFTPADETDSATHYAYGIWDRPAAYAANAVILTQTLTETNYTYTPTSPAGATAQAIRVRTATNNLPNWTAGAANHMGWKTALPIGGERIIGDGAYVTGAVFLFLSTNPTINPTLTPPSENWWMQLNALTGGDNGTIRFDLNSSATFTSADNVTVSTSQVSPVGRQMGGGVRSQLTAFTTAGFDIYFANYDKNGDPPPPPGTAGVNNGHFDEDIFYGSLINANTATATITVGNSGQTSPFPATLGAITIDGVVVVPPLSVTNLPDGSATTANANTIKNLVTGGYTATVSGDVITLTAPASGASFNGKTIAIADGSAQTLVPYTAAVPGITAVTGVTGARPANGALVMTAVGRNKTISLQCGSTYIGNSSNFTSSNNSSASTRLDNLYSSINGTNVNGYTMNCTKSPNTSSPTSISCSVVAPVGISACSGGFSVDNDITTTTNTGPVGGVNAVAAVAGVAAVPAVAQSGWTNFKPALTVTTFSGGLDGATIGDNCTSCPYDLYLRHHVHQYDDRYDVTGVNYLNSSPNPESRGFNLSLAISSATRFKVLMQNQYLNPAVKIHLNGSPGYVHNIDQGYTSVRNYNTSATLGTKSDLTVDLPDYSLNDVNSLAINMPVDALTAKNWWGNGDVRAGLIPTRPGCVIGGAGVYDGNMYQPINPPVNGAQGPGTKGWSTTTTPATATGARHGGALVVQVIRENTPRSEIEMNVTGRPEYGWRVKSTSYSTYVLAEWITYWHYPNNICYGETGWVKDPGPDNGSSSLVAKRAGSTDPRVGNLGVGAPPTPGATSVTNLDGSVTTTTILLDLIGGGYTTTVEVRDINGVVTSTTSTHTSATVDIGGVVDSNGVVGGGVTTPLDSLGRINWRELFNN